MPPVTRAAPSILAAAGRRPATLMATAAFAVLATTACRRPPEKPVERPGNASVPAPAPARPPAPPLVAARAVAGGYAFTPAESAAVDDFLRRNPTLRAATDADHKPGSESDAELRTLYGVYHPYFVRGDLNDDGVIDFVLGFVRRDAGHAAAWFSIVVFTGRAAPGGSSDFSSGIFIERDVTLARGDISVDRDSIVISPDLDDDTARRYRWDPTTHTFVFVHDDEDSDSRPSVSQTARGGGKGIDRSPSSPVRF